MSVSVKSAAATSSCSTSYWVLASEFNHEANTAPMRVQGVVVDLGAGPHRGEKLPTQNSPWTRKMTELIAGI
jgi:hypothetical protein